MDEAAFIHAGAFLPAAAGHENRYSLHEGDCGEVLPVLPGGSVRCCVTSPPYWNPRRGTAEQYVDRMTAVFREVSRILSPNGTLWLILGDDPEATGVEAGMPERVEGALLADGWCTKGRVVWEESAGQRQWVFAFTKSAGTGPAIAEDVWRFATPPVASDYAWSMLPEELAARCIEASSVAGEVVLDPYCGLGSVGIAALRGGRAFVGIERDRRVLQLAWERLRKTAVQ